MQTTLKAALAAAGITLATQAAAQVTFYDGEGLRGPSFTADREIRNFERRGFNDRASSAYVERGRWEVCEDLRYGGRCVVLDPGRYDSLSRLGINNRISSVRPLDGYASYDDRRYGAYDDRGSQHYGYDVRGDERLYQVPVRSVRAVVGPPEQRCWVERGQIVEDRGERANVPGALVGGLIGGILGHQIGSGRGNDVATIGGALAGAAIGGNVGRDRDGRVASQDVQRCASVDSRARPEYWDVTYEFRGMEHRAQFSSPPGDTITVNENGEPRMG